MSASSTLSCDVCSADVVPFGQCHTCNGNLCQQCYQTHPTARLFKGHVVSLLFTDQAGETVSPTLDITDEKCSIHTREFISFYCEQHDSTGCGVCMTKNHRQCPTPVDLTEAASLQDQSDLLNAFRSDIVCFGNDLDIAVQEVKQNLDTCKESRSRCHTDLKKTRERIDLKLDVWQKQIKQDIDDTHSKTETLLQSICNTHLDAKEKLDTYKEDIGKLRDAEQFARLELSRKRSNIDMAKLKANVQEAMEKNHITTYDFNPNPELMESLFTNVKSFGTLTEQNFGSDDASVDGSSSSAQQVTNCTLSDYFVEKKH
mgnify:FL=1